MLENLLKLKEFKVLDKPQQSSIKGAGHCSDPNTHHHDCHENV